MIRFFIGEDSYGARNAMREAIASVRKESPNALETHHDDTSFDPIIAREALSGGGMFGVGNIIIFDGIFEHAEGCFFYEKVLPDFFDTEHHVFIRESALDKKILEKLKKKAIISEFVPLKKPEIRSNNFAIADAIGAKDKKNIWVEFEKARRSGRAMEELHGTIFWAFKSMYICATKKKEEAIASGMKEYSYRTYFNYAKNFLIPEIEDKLAQLKEMYHAAHRGEEELDVLIEKFLLKL